ncbi:MAG: hypothetical protein SF066_16185 [Thermoanaerobaculia bacterium]|nr:hypothetical protein [Thermoanaerobaculia bacterium]
MNEAPAAIEIGADVRASHRALGPLNEEFLDYVAAEPACRRRANFAVLEHAAFYPLASWPVFLGLEQRDEMARASIAVTRLLKTVPGRIFRGDMERLAAFYQLANPTLAGLILEEPNGIEAAIARVDLVLGSAGLKVLEVNLGAPGGLQVAAAEDTVRAIPELRRFFDQVVGHRPCWTTNSLAELLDHVLEDVLAHVTPSAGDLNVGFVADVEFPPEIQRAVVDYVNSVYGPVLRRRAPGRTGEVVVGSFLDLVSRADGVYFGAAPLAGIIELVATQWLASFHHWKSRQVALYNGPVAILLDDKRNLGFLSEFARSPLFTAEERAVVERWVPWTRAVKTGYTSWRGERVNLPELLGRERENLVLKPAQSSQGNGVLIGAGTPPASWETAVREALARSDWVVQEFHESLPYLCQYGEEGVAVHDFIWGIFVFGSRYGGGFLRMMPRGRNLPINAAKGAQEGIVFELDQPQGGV